MNKFEAFFVDLGKVIETHLPAIEAAIQAAPPSPIAIALSGFVQALEALETVVKNDGTLPK